jgi:hypothetical protein
LSDKQEQPSGKTADAIVQKIGKKDPSLLPISQYIFKQLEIGNQESFIGRCLPKVEKSNISTIVDFLRDQAKSASPMSGASLLHPGETFHGLSYGDLFARWNNWLLSSHPTYDGGDILFTRGNLGYNSDPTAFLDMTNLSGNGQKISSETAIFVPIITCQFNIGDQYGGGTLQDEETVRKAVRDHIYGGGQFWATIMKRSSPSEMYFIGDLKGFYVESPRFQLIVPEDSVLRTSMEYPLEPGVYDAVVGGYCVLLKELPDPHCTINFGGKGRYDYYTNSLYDIDIIDEPRDPRQARQASRATDISLNRHPYELVLEKYFK